MRLLNTRTMLLESLPNRLISDIPDYAVLSHRWDEDEVTFEDMKTRPEGLQDRKGYKKIQKCCQLASSTGFEYIWIDTCCINKANKHELTDTLASMFHYYRNAQVCYTYLADVPGDDNPYEAGSAFRRCSWFSRGWTLQELVAPLYVSFFDQDWNEIGTKSSLQAVIREITGIPSQVLLMNSGGVISIAERMIWAEDRETSEPEDKAYCMMGLLGVKMPVRYGEGEETASKRLAEQIAKLQGSSRDPSSFNVSSWMRPEREYQFFISTQQRPDKPTRIEYPEDGPQWTINEEEVRLLFGGSGNCAVLMFKNASGDVFAVCLGVHNYNVWCGMTADCEDEDIKKVAKAYWDGDKGSARWDNMDRRAIQLPSGEIPYLAIRKGRRDRKRAYFVEVSAGEDFWLDKVGPGVFPGWWKG
ncbi:heterokaryon incompatibility protein-domain-containing protein [Hypomontagnella submonticulosa]|nr:heterokaryon incompatibility protein-domain-containing protein [Hypomontagnella submonticulosa]